MERFLACLLARAVPEVCVKSVMLVRTSLRHHWIRVKPDHYGYWECFRQKYPQGTRIALSLEASRPSLERTFCPEFSSPENLIKWLSDVLKLTQGERRLLTLSIQGGRWNNF